MDKNPETEDMMKLAVKKYREGHIEIDYDKGCKQTQRQYQSVGPIGYLIDELESIGAEIDEQLVVRHRDEQPVNIKKHPWQRLKEDIQSVAKVKRAKKAAEERTNYQGLEEVDNDAIREALKADQKRKSISSNTTPHWLPAPTPDTGL